MDAVFREFLDCQHPEETMYGNLRKDLELNHVLMELLRRKWVILCISLLGAVFFYAYSALLITPMYRATVSFYISNMSGTDVQMLTNSDVSASENLVDTYVYILSSNTVLDAVAEKSGLDLSGSALREMVTVSSIDGTGLCKVEVLSPEPQLSTDSASAIARCAPAEVASIVEGSSIKVVEYAEMPDAPVTPNLLRNTMTGLLLGFLISVCVVLLRMAHRGKAVFAGGIAR